MKYFIINPILSLICIFCYSDVMAKDFSPKLQVFDKSENIICQKSLKIAQNQFNSDAFYLYYPIAIPQDFDDKLIIKIKDEISTKHNNDISGGDVLKSEDEKFFEKRLNNENIRSAYWQVNPIAGKRIVLNEHPMGWRGDRYEIFVIDGSLSFESFMHKIGGYDEKINPDILRFSTEWRPPFIIKSGNSDKIWIIAANYFDYLGLWDVYVLNNKGFKKYCSIEFKSDSEKLETLLPESLQKLTKNLEEIVNNVENPLHNKAMLANLIMRPYALKNVNPYNTKQEVENGLLSWSKVNRKRSNLYKEMQKQYKISEVDLSKYYQKQFVVSKDKADKYSKYALDLAYRSYFSFHSEAEGSYFRNTNNQEVIW